MKTKNIILLSSLGLLFGLVPLFNQGNKVEIVKATTTDMDAIAPESGETLDTAHTIYDDFSSGLSMERWAVSKKAWGNSNVSNNSGVIPENVFYNSTDKTVVFRALGDYYQDNDVNYDLHHTYGYAHDDSTGNGRVYSRDGTRTGGCIKTREAYGPGRFEARFKAAPVEGACTAFWTFNYGSSGKENYNEIDFELPTHIAGSEGDAENDLYFDQIICTTYKTETKYRSQRVQNPVYLNDGEYHTYCLDWYYSGRTKKVNWFIDGNLIASCNGDTYVSNHVGRVTLGVWIPGRASFCGIPNFDKAYMELDYFKYTPFLDQDYTDAGLNALDSYSNSFTTITSTPKYEFFPNGEFNYGLPEHFTTLRDVSANKSYNNPVNNNSYGIKIAGNGGASVSSLTYTNPNVRGISDLKLTFDYKGWGSVRVLEDSSQIYSSGTLSSPSEWTTFERNISKTALAKDFTIAFESESNDVGFYIDNIHLAYGEPNPIPVEVDDNYSFFARNNGQTSTSSSEERRLCPDGDINHEWILSCGKYYIKNDDSNTIYAKPSTTVMDSTSGSVYYPIKQCLKSASLFSDSDKTAAFIMNFDVSDFTDLDISLYSFSGVAGRQIHILYSLNSGTSWSILVSNIECSSLTGTTPIFKYNYTIVSPVGLKGQTIRFAIIGNRGSSDDGYRFNSVTINNYNNFIAKLDGATCSLDDDLQIFLARQYSLLSPSELTILGNTMMNSYPQTYAEGYSYLLSYWGEPASSFGPLFSRDINKENAMLAALIIVSSAFAILIVYSLIRTKRKD